MIVQKCEILVDSSAFPRFCALSVSVHEMTSPSKSRVIVVTGVSRGLGQAMVRKFTQAGHKVCGCARNTEHLSQLRNQLSSNCRLDPVDVADPAAVATWAASVLDAFGPPDLLLNNAAVINSNRSLWEVSEREFRQLIDVNVNGVFHVLHSFLPAMVKRRKGVIVNFSSGWGRSVSAQVAPYCASKWAIEGLTQALAEELPAGMCAVPLNPGVINTDMLRSCFGSGAAYYPEADEWAERAVPFLLGITEDHNGMPLTVPG